MWNKSFREFLDRSLQHAGEWACGVMSLRARFVGWCIASIAESMPARLGIERAEALFAVALLQGDWHADFTYRFRSLRCEVRVGLAEPTPGMQFIYRALQESTEAQTAETWRQ